MFDDLIDVVIDCESLSLDPHAAIWQIGARCGNQTFKQTINPDWYSESVNPFDVDQNTLEWQYKHNSVNFADARTINPEVSPSWLLASLVQWLGEFTGVKLAVWSRHPIDVTWLTHMSKVTGVALPWKYYQCFDLATAAHLAGERLGKPPAGVHDALVDASFDYDELMRLRRKLRGLG